MNGANDAVLTLARGGMEITWRYAWVLFLTQIALNRQFPFALTVCAFLTAAAITQVSAGKTWRVYQRLLLQTAGFIPFGLLLVHTIAYQNDSLFDLGWVAHLFLGDKSITHWFALILTVFCAWLIWRGGRILMNGSPQYHQVCLHFDKGLGLFFGLLIVRAVGASKFGLFLPGRDMIFLTVAYFVFGLTAISVARNQSNVERSFLAGRRGLGIILSVAAMATLLGTGTILLVYPFLFNVADSLLVVMKDASRPVGAVLIQALLYLLRRKEKASRPHELDADGSTVAGPDQLPLTDMPEMEGGPSLLQLIVGWGLFGLIALAALAVLTYVLIYLFGLLLKRSHGNTPRPMSTGWLWDLLRTIAGLPLFLWRWMSALATGVDCAATVYAGLLRWGKKSGVAAMPSETPTEYGSRLTVTFPGLRSEIELIVEAFNREIYGQATTGRQKLSRLRSAQRRMRHLFLWPSRLKAWWNA